MSMSKREVAEQLAHERRMLAARRATLNAAQEQAASYGLNVPLDLVNVQRQLAEQIAAHQQEIAHLEALAPTAPDAPAPTAETAGDDQPFWAGLGLGAGGDMIIADVGVGAQNVAVGKNISQHSAGAPADERAEVEAALAALEVALRGLDGAAPLLGLLPLQVGLLRGELTKSPPDTPSASTITQVGDWLIGALPGSAPALARLFAAPSARRALERAGPQAVAWARSRIGVA